MEYKAQQMSISTARASVIQELVDQRQCLLLVSAATEPSLGLGRTEQESHNVSGPRGKRSKRKLLLLLLLDLLFLLFLPLLLRIIQITRINIFTKDLPSEQDWFIEKVLRRLFTGQETSESLKALLNIKFMLESNLEHVTQLLTNAFFQLNYAYESKGHAYNCQTGTLFFHNLLKQTNKETNFQKQENLLQLQQQLQPTG